MEKVPKNEGEQLKIDFSKTEKETKDVKFLRNEVIELCNKNKVDYYAFARNIINQLESKYPDSHDYSFYHILAGGSPPDSCIKKDFPGGDSIFGKLTLFSIELKINLKKANNLESKLPEKQEVSKETEKSRAEKNAEKSKNYMTGQWD